MYTGMKKCFDQRTHLCLLLEYVWVRTVPVYDEDIEDIYYEDTITLDGPIIIIEARLHNDKIIFFLS